MKKVIRLTESDLTRLVKRAVNESSKNENTSKMDELKDEGVIHNDVSNHIIYLVKQIIKKEN